MFLVQGFEKVLRQQVEELVILGVVVVVFEEGEFLMFVVGMYEEVGFWVFEVGEIFCFGSVSKLFLVVVLLQFVDEGVFVFDDMIVKYVDGVFGGESILL